MVYPIAFEMKWVDSSFVLGGSEQRLWANVSQFSREAGRSWRRGHSDMVEEEGMICLV